jgi:hypothetical protein
MMTAQTGKAFATIEWLTQTICLHCFSGDTVIDELQKFIRAQGDDPEHRGAAYEARDALIALRDAAASLIGDIEQDLDALTIGLTADEARHVFNEYANDQSSKMI